MTTALIELKFCNCKYSQINRSTKDESTIHICTHIDATSPTSAFSSSNDTIQSFSKAKKALEKKVYFDHKATIYCFAQFDSKKNVFSPEGFLTEKHKKRAKRVEWEHVVPCRNFGQFFTELKGGHQQCVNKGKSFKGRRCAGKINKEHRVMQSDIYNSFSAIGAVNAMRNNYNFVALVDKKRAFGSGDMEIHNRKAEPPRSSKGRIARTYLDMDSTYKRYSMSKSPAQLIKAWDKMYPVSEWECKRAKRIENIQGNVNIIMAEECSRFF
jgi:deoxyribonuclease-1